MSNATDITGQRFGRLLVLERAQSPDEYARWLCQCDCGNNFIGRGHTLRDGRTRSCGCLAREVAADRARTHGATVGGKWSPEYRSYQKMRERCLNPNHTYYKNYGGRGIVICERWLNSFDAFLADMGEKPSPKHTIERNNNDGDYEPSNCRWATRAEQNRNTRRTRKQNAGQAA